MGLGQDLINQCQDNAHHEAGAKAWAAAAEAMGLEKLVARYGEEVCLQRYGWSLGKRRPWVNRIEFDAEHEQMTRNVMISELDFSDPKCLVRGLAPDANFVNLTTFFDTPYARQEVLDLCEREYFGSGDILTFTHSTKGYLEDGTKIAPLPSIYSSQWRETFQALEEAGVIVFTSSGNATPGFSQSKFRHVFNRLLGSLNGPLPRNVFDCGPLATYFSWWGWYRTKLVAPQRIPCGATGSGQEHGIITINNSSIPTAAIAAMFAVAQSCWLEETGNESLPSDWIDIVCRGMSNLEKYKMGGITIGREFDAYRLLCGMVDGPLKEGNKNAAS